MCIYTYIYIYVNPAETHRDTTPQEAKALQSQVVPMGATALRTISAPREVLPCGCCGD